MRWLLLDELRHLIRSRAVLVVLFSLPLLLGVGAIQPGDRLANQLLFMVLMGSNLAGVVCGATVATSCVADLQQGTPVLFAVRPVPRWHLLLARFCAVVLLLAGTMALSLLLVAGGVKLLSPEFPALAAVTAKGLALIVANALLLGALGVLLGVTVSSPLTAVMLYLLLGTNLGNGVGYLILEESGDASQFWLRLGLTELGAMLLTGLLLWISARIFARKPL